MGTIETLEIIRERVTSLPMLSAVANRLLAIIGDAKYSHKDVVKIVETDAGLTTKVLRIANSAAYSRGRQIETISRAIVMLGETMVMGVAIGSCTDQVFRAPLEGYESTENELWDHSLRSAIIARRLSKFVKTKGDFDIAFTGGIIHDIGKSILSEFLKSKHEELQQFWDFVHEDGYDALERNLFGVDHSEVGYHLAKHWNFPEPLCEIIRYHHSPQEASDKYKPLVYIVHLSDLFAMMHGSGTGMDTLAYKLDADYKDFIELKKEDLEHLLLDVSWEFDVTKTSVMK